ncbi:DUF945 domain-containing protein (plasmid) [Burkholderia thailandensis]|jgi:hypothetical protein|uniref:DUF932 domain-containing protein n=1 Tax=Burkholderia thailandensis TaxID=57975 RepID=UPI00192E14A9|nr:DUF932 domain-containing protein [Burkholderia thailandensis]MBS2132061.1 DUF945 domain-containing protein [Burkholderia thailandensis]QRA15175.1 DUF945 domain-containing protein [Burkholderia thailandensis]
MQFGLTTSYMRQSVRSHEPLTDEQIRKAAPSIFAECPHESRSERYALIPTIEVLNGLRKEGFQPFMVMQTNVRAADKREHAKHLIRLRHSDQTGNGEWNEIVLVNSSDGTSSYQMFGGVFRQVCSNGMICGESVADVRIPHRGNVVDKVVESAHIVLDGFGLITEHKDAMKALTLNDGEQAAFARAALALKYDDPATPAPITESQVLRARRAEDQKADMWSTFNKIQENLTKGQIPGRSATGRRIRTRPVTGLDADVKLNRALWVLAEEMRKLKA